MISVCTSYFRRNLIADYFQSLEGAQVLLWSLDGVVPDYLRAYTKGSGKIEQGAAWNHLSQWVRPDDIGVLFMADDIRLCPNFLSRFLTIALEVGADLAAPAHSRRSDSPWKLMRRRPWLKARQVSWVESTCLFVRREMLADLLPFPEDGYAGWGLDYYTSEKAAKLGKKIFIIDDVTIEHGWRPLSSTYNKVLAEAYMQDWILEKKIQIPEKTTFSKIPKW